MELGMHRARDAYGYIELGMHRLGMHRLGMHRARDA